MAVVSWSQFEHGWFTAYRRMAQDRPDLVLHLGDYQYDYRKDTYISPSGTTWNGALPESEIMPSRRHWF